MARQWRPKKNVEEWSVITYEAGLALEKDIVFPVRLRAVFVPGGWKKVANNITEFRDLLKTGLDISPVFEVLIGWENPPKTPQG